MARSTNAARQPLTAERLRELLDYDPKTGRMTWRVNVGSRAAKGSEAGTMDGRGYVCITLDGRRYRRARLAFLHMTGAWPEQECDHRNGICDDDRWSNLRDVSRSENLRNRRCFNRHGMTGVDYRPDCRKPWRARILVDGKLRSLGNYATKAEAAHAYSEASKQLHGRHAASKRRAPGKSTRYVSAADIRHGDKLVDIMLAAEAAEAGAA